MGLNYPRTNYQRTSDFSNARENEELVGSWLPDPKVNNLTSTTKMDWEVDGVMIDVKEKRQPLTEKWPLPHKTLRNDAFIIDELSVRRALHHYPNAFFVLHDFPNKRWFLARIDELVCAKHEKLDRIGPKGHPKGKWVCDLKDFREMKDPAKELWPTIQGDLKEKQWDKSGCHTPVHYLS